MCHLQRLVCGYFTASPIVTVSPQFSSAWLADKAELIFRASQLLAASTHLASVQAGIKLA
jgi:hypothetical protein